MAVIPEQYHSMNIIIKRNTIVSTGLALILSSVNLISCNNIASSVKPHVRDSTALPAFDILLTDTITKFNTDKIPVDKPIVLFFFGPDCPQCDALIRNIVTHMDTLKDIRFLMLSIANFHDAKVYEEKYQLNKYKNVILGLDYSNYFISFKAPGFPLLVFFDKNKKAKRAKLGSVPIDSIRAIVDK